MNTTARRLCLERKMESLAFKEVPGARQRDHSEHSEGPPVVQILDRSPYSVEVP